jgi:dienelactone hydrolase
MIIKNHCYSVAEKQFTGYLALDQARVEKGPGVLVLHEGDGLSEHTKERANRLAALGYVAYAPDLYGERFSSRKQGVAVITALVQDSAALRARVIAAFNSLKDLPEVDASQTAAIGFCFGGFAALELARSGCDVGCVVSFHGGLGARTPAVRGEIKARVLVCTGADDPHVPREQRSAFEDEMTAADADWQMMVLGGARHAFTNRTVDPSQHPGSAYHKPSDERSWAVMLSLFTQSFESRMTAA